MRPSTGVADGEVGSSLAFGTALSLIALTAFVIRVAYVTMVARHVALGFDAVWYTFESGPLAHGKGFVDPAVYFQSAHSVPTAVHPPLYPVFLAAITRIFNGHDETFRLIGAAAGTVTVVCTGFIGRRVAGPRVGLVAAGLAAIYPSLIAVDGSLMSETIAVPLLLGMTWLALATIERPSRWRFALLGVLGGLTTLARSDAVIAAALVIMTAAFAVARGRRARALLGLTAVATLALVVTPWAVRNDVRVGTPAIATLSTATTISGANCQSTYAGPLLGYWDPTCLDEQRRGTLDEATWNSRETQYGLDYARAHVSRMPLVVVARELRVLGLFHPLAQARLDATETRSYRWQLLAWAAWLPVMGLGALGLLRIARARGRAALPLFGVVAAVAITVAVSYGNARFRTACEPVFLVGAAELLASSGSRRLVGAARRVVGRRTGPRIPAASPASPVPMSTPRSAPRTT